MVIVSGLRWAKELADQVLLLLGLLLLTAGVAVGGVLLHRPASFLGVFVGVVIILMLGEGAYRVWREADAKLVAESAKTQADEVWVNRQLDTANTLLERWTPNVRLDVDRSILQEAVEWERETSDGLTERLPKHSGHFGVDVGFGSEWFRAYVGEPAERARFRRRIHRLAEIMERLGSQSGRA
jgi:hypothetical protein